MLGFLKRKQANDALFLLDIGTHSVKTTIVRLPNELESKPVTLARAEQPLPETVLFGRYFHDLDQLLDIVNQTLEHTVIASGTEPSLVALGLSANSIQYVGQTVRIHRDDPEVEVSKRELEEILQRVETETTSVAKEKIGLGAEWVHLGIAVTDYKIGGSFVKSPLGLVGETVDCTVLHGFWEERIQKSVDAFANQLSLSIDMVWETALARALRARENHESCVVVDIGGKATECIILKNRRVVANTTINIGSDLWTQAIARELKISDSQAEKVKRAFHEGVLDQERSASTKDVLESEISTFMHLIAAALHDTAHEEPLPSALYFGGEGSKIDLVKSKVIAYPWTQGGLFEAFPHVGRIEDTYMNESLYYGYTILS